MTCDRFEREGREARESLLEAVERLQAEIETVCSINLFLVCFVCLGFLFFKSFFWVLNKDNFTEILSKFCCAHFTPAYCLLFC